MGSGIMQHPHVAMCGRTYNVQPFEFRDPKEEATGVGFRVRIEAAVLHLQPQHRDRFLKHVLRIVCRTAVLQDVLSYCGDSGSHTVTVPRAASFRNKPFTPIWR
jgi:hypothetical protein